MLEYQRRLPSKSRDGWARGCFTTDENIADTGDEGGRIELGTKDDVGTIGMNGHAPVADEGDELVGVRRLDG